MAEAFNEGYTCSVGLAADNASGRLVYDAAKKGKDGFFIVPLFIGIQEVGESKFKK